MKIYLADLKKYKLIWDQLPPDFKRLNESDYFLFYYEFDDATSKMSLRGEEKVVMNITHAIYRNMPHNAVTGQYYSVGYFQQPFDSQNALFYHWLRLIIGDDDTTTKFFRDCRAQDIAQAAESNKRTVFGNSYSISSRGNVETALNKYLDDETTQINGCLAISDMFDCYTRKTLNKSLYGPILTKIVGAVKNPNGGLIPEGNGQMQYMYVGENSKVSGSDPKLTQAKNMMRAGMRFAQIYLETGWFFNKYDAKWRKRISDKEVKIADVKPGHAFIRPGSKFTEEVIFDTLQRIQTTENAAAELDKYIEQGWDVTLGDILYHPELYKHYPELYKVPCFFGVSENKNNYTFYYNPKAPMLVIFGSPEIFDLKTTMLHETQHAIQRIEGFGAGGSPDFAQLITAIGGKNVKEYLFLSTQIEDEYRKWLHHTYEYQVFKAVIYNWPAEIKHQLKSFAFSEKIYLDNIHKVVSILINIALNENTASYAYQYFNGIIRDLIEKLRGYIKLGDQVSYKLRSEGFSDRDVSKIFFNAYEALAGEIEARDTQHSSQVDDDISDYLLPLSSETLDESKINTIIDETGDRPVMFPSKIKGACETTPDGKYIIHLSVSNNPETFLHEFGHLLCDMFFKDWYGDHEGFIELFLCYLVNKNIVPALTPLLKDNRTNLHNHLFDHRFDLIFADQGIEPLGLEFIPYRNYLTKLTELVNG